MAISCRDDSEGECERTARDKKTETVVVCVCWRPRTLEGDSNDFA